MTESDAKGISPWWLVAVSVVASLAGAYLALTLVTADLANWGLWLRDFARSPGAAGVAAVVTAGIAFSGIMKQVAVSRAALVNQARVAQADAWWAMFEWVSDRALPPRAGDRPLHESVTIRTLQRLADEAVSEVQKAACAGVMGVVSQSVEPELVEGAGGSDGQEEGEGVPQPTQTRGDEDAAVAALESYVTSQQGTSAASHLAESRAYENRVLKALLALSWKFDDIDVYRNPPTDGLADAIVEVGDRRVRVVIKSWADASKGRPPLLRTVKQMLVQGATQYPTVVISPVNLTLGDREVELRAVAVQWRGPEDSVPLVVALRRAGQMSRASESDQPR